MQKITPFLWFDSEAEEAAQFYVSIFKHARLGNITLWNRRVRDPSTTGRQGQDRRIRAGRTSIRRVERRSDIQVQRVRLVPGALRDAGRARLLLEQALGRRRREGAAMRLVERQIRAVVADHAVCLGQDVER